MSPDGKHVLVAATDSHSLILFARDPATSAITQLQGFEGCLSDFTNGPEYCHAGVGLALPLGIAFSPDGQYVFTGSFGHGSVAAFAHDPANGGLSQVGPCISQGDADCERGAPLGRAGWVTASPDGRHVYVNAPSSSAVLTFAVGGREVRFPALVTKKVRVHARKATVNLGCPADAADGCLGTIESTTELRGIRGKWSKPVAFDLAAGDTVALTLPARGSGFTRLAIRVTATDDRGGEARMFLRSLRVMR